MIRWPRLLGGTHKLVGWLNQLALSCRAAEVKEVKNGTLVRNTDGLTIICGGVGGGTSDIWAEPKKYDHTKSYGKSKLVVIMPTDSIVTTGVVSASVGTAGTTVQAQPGIWLSMQSVAPVPYSSGPDVYRYHVPRFPLPNESDIDSTDNYWMQITKFCE